MFSETLFDNREKIEILGMFGPWRPQFWPERKFDWKSFVIIFGDISNVIFFVFLYDQ